MIRRFLRNFRRRKTGEINPEEIFIDSSNLPQFDVYQFEGRLETPISRKTIVFLSVFFFLLGGVYISRFWILQIHKGDVFAAQSENNRLNNIDIFANRGVIFDRNGVELASNAKYEADSDFAQRVYAPIRGIAHVIGYVKYPTKDKAGFYFKDEYSGEAGVEKTYHNLLSGQKGTRVVETDALGRITSQSVIRPPKDGENLKLTIDSRISDKVYEIMEKSSQDYGFTGGAAAIMDVTNGDLLALVSYPEYSSSLMAEGDKKAISGYLTDPHTPFLDRVVSGLYTPGSIVKPAVAMAALTEGVITPEKEILSTGSISIPNPYFPDKPTIFNDWRAQGWVDIRHAIAYSSDVYFYEVGGGFQDQPGLGIARLDKYFRMFGLGEKTGFDMSLEKDGVIPTPEWKEKVFNGDPWRVGDTYNTSIGQYGVQFTPIQIVRYMGSIANEGTLYTPRLVHSETPSTSKTVPLRKDYFDIIHEGMHLGASQGGTAAAVDVPYVDIAAKTGTAELGVQKHFVNSWITGFFPYDNPKYAFVVMMEKGPRSNLIGASYVMRQLLDWMNQNTPEYFK